MRIVIGKLFKGKFNFSQEIQLSSNILLFHIYNDETVEKRIIIE